MASKINKRFMKVAKRLHTAFERRIVGAYKTIFDTFPDMSEAWLGLLREKTRVEAADIRPTQEGMREAQRLLRQLRGYVCAVKNNSGYLVQRIDNCSQELSGADTGDYSTVPSLTDCYDQIKALESEFGTCQLNTQLNTITTMSHDVQLGNITFGRYYIQIDLDKLEQNNHSFYRVTPVSEECPTVGESTHPHLMNGSLCEGEGASAIAKAYADGRLYDCCLLINSILQTYGRNPYVELDRFGHDDDYDYECETCGTGIYEDDRFCCSACDRTMCRGCVSHCGAVGNWVCEECLNNARDNDEPCVTSCHELGSHDCFVRENERCPECDDVHPDRELAKCEIMPTEAQLCIDCAKSLAEEQTPCDSCLMHGHMGCALIAFGYPVLNTRNHPACVTARGRQHMHHNLGWHHVGLFHPAQPEGDARADFQAYGQFLDARNRTDYTRRQREGLTMVNSQQLAALVGENS